MLIYFCDTLLYTAQRSQTCVSGRSFEKRGRKGFVFVIFLCAVAQNRASGSASCVKERKTSKPPESWVTLCRKANPSSRGEVKNQRKNSKLKRGKISFYRRLFFWLFRSLANWIIGLLAYIRSRSGTRKTFNLVDCRQDLWQRKKWQTPRNQWRRFPFTYK